VNALAYGEPARYWSPSIDGATGILQDPFFYPWGDADLLRSNGKNSGVTLELAGGAVDNFTTVGEVIDRRFFQNVSPFLTGRRYLDHLDPVDRWQDDGGSGAEIAPDNSMDGLFIVNDPSNDGDFDFPYVSSNRPGFNDLILRLNGLCLFVNQSCAAGPNPPVVGVLGMMGQVSFVPLPLGGH
jgi:hypothetical protein